MEIHCKLSVCEEESFGHRPYLVFVTLSFVIKFFIRGVIFENLFTNLAVCQLSTHSALVSRVSY